MTYRIFSVKMQQKSIHGALAAAYLKYHREGVSFQQLNFSCKNVSLLKNDIC